MGASASKVQIWNRALYRIGESESVESESDERLSARICRDVWDDVVIECFEALPWPFAKKQVALAQPVSAWDETTTYAAAAQVRYEGIVYTAQQSTTGNNPADDDGTYWGGAQPLGTGWDYVYTLPADCITPLALLATDERTETLPLDSRHPFAIQQNATSNGRLLCCGLDSDDFDALEYIARPGFSAAGEWVDRIPMWSRTFVSAVIYRLAAELALPIKKDEGTAGKMMQAYYFALSEAFARELNGQQPDIEPDTPLVLARS